MTCLRWASGSCSFLTDNQLLVLEFLNESANVVLYRFARGMEVDANLVDNLLRSGAFLKQFPNLCPDRIEGKTSSAPHIAKNRTLAAHHRANVLCNPHVASPVWSLGRPFGKSSLLATPSITSADKKL